MIYDLKILPKYYEDVRNGKKEFEIRKNDRDYKINDVLLLREFDGEKYTGRAIEKTIKYIYHGTGEYGLSVGYCILGLSRL